MIVEVVPSFIFLYNAEKWALMLIGISKCNLELKML